MQVLFCWLNSAYKEKLHLSHGVSELQTRDWNLSATINIREGAGVSLLALKIPSGGMLKQAHEGGPLMKRWRRSPCPHMSLCPGLARAGAKHREPLLTPSPSPSGCYPLHRAHGWNSLHCFSGTSYRYCNIALMLHLKSFPSTQGHSRFPSIQLK